MHTTFESQMSIGDELPACCFGLGFSFGFGLGGIFGCIGCGGCNDDAEALNIYLCRVNWIIRFDLIGHRFCLLSHTSGDGLSSSRWNRVCLHVARMVGADVMGVKSDYVQRPDELKKEEKKKSDFASYDRVVPCSYTTPQPSPSVLIATMLVSRLIVIVDFMLEGGRTPNAV